MRVGADQLWTSQALVLVPEAWHGRTRVFSVRVLFDAPTCGESAMRRTFSTFTIASCCRSLVPRWTMKSVRTSCAIALGLSWAGVGMADEIAGPANVNAATDPLVALKQLGSGLFPPDTWNVRANEIDFSIIDITGTITPVRIASGTPTNTLRLKHDGGLSGISASTETPMTVPICKSMLPVHSRLPHGAVRSAVS